MCPFYDEGSCCFNTAALLEQLNAVGMPVNLYLKTMHDSVCSISNVINDLRVKQIRLERII